MKKKTISVILVALMMLSSTVLAAADGSSALKLIYGSSAPEIPSVPTVDEVFVDWENEDVEPQLPVINRSDWDAFFEYVKANDPDYYYGNGYTDPCEGEYPFILSEIEAEEAVTFNGMYELSTKVEDYFTYYFEKYTNEYNDRVKEGTTYVTEDMKAVKNTVPSMSPFDRAYVASLNAEMDPEGMTQTLQSVLGMLDMGSDGRVEVPEDNRFVATYKSEKYDDDYISKYDVNVTLDCIVFPDAGGCGFYEEVRRASDGSVVETEMHEFMRLGDDFYALQTNNTRLYVQFDGEKIGSFAYSVLSGSEYTREADSMFNVNGEIDGNWTVDREVSDYSIASARDEQDYMKLSNGGKYYTIYIEN